MAPCRVQSVMGYLPTGRLREHICDLQELRAAAPSIFLRATLPAGRHVLGRRDRASNEPDPVNPRWSPTTLDQPDAGQRGRSRRQKEAWSALLPAEDRRGECVQGAVSPATPSLSRRRRALRVHPPAELFGPTRATRTGLPNFSGIAWRSPPACCLR